MRICIVGDPGDLSAAYISWLAEQRGMEVVELNEASLGVDWSFSFSDTDRDAGYIERSGEHFPFSTICGAFVRLNPEPGLPETLSLSPDEIGVFVVERRHAMQHFLNCLPFAVANQPFGGRSNVPTPHQMNLLRRAGFLVPCWIESNDEQIVRGFSREHQDLVIYKSCSGLRSKVRLLDEELLRRLQEGTSPIVVQEYIRGYDVRVHVVKKNIFATRIRSAGIDYRFDSQNNEFRETSVPEDIQELCIRFSKDESLTIGGFDFRVTENGEWYCLEMNPVPTFLPYEMSTGQAIGNAILDVFAEGI